MSAQLTGLDLTWDGRTVAFSISALEPGGDNRLFVLDGAGRELWTATQGLKILGVSLSGDGQYVAIGLLDFSIALFSRTGERLWQHKSVGLPLLSPRGEMLVTFNSGANDVPNTLLEVFLPNGEKAWTLQRKGRVWRGIVSDHNDVLLGLWTGEVLLIDRSRRILRQQMFPPDVMALAMSPEDAQYLAVATGVLDKGLHLFKRKGRLVWRRPLPEGATEVSLAKQGAFILGYGNTIHGQRLSLYGRNGELRWTYHLKEPATESSKAVIVPDQDMVIAGVERDHQYYLQGFTLAGELRWVAPVPGPIFDFRASRDGRYIAAATDNALYFFDTHPAAGAKAHLTE
ncbi:MAG: hypothetical protein HYZ81_16170 [Nitrospinae bacterium]|nr:hypothetical protein [Nitrospinota bacterium]